jgi:biotin operon repressor
MRREHHEVQDNSHGCNQPCYDLRLRDQRNGRWYWAPNKFIDQLAPQVGADSNAVYHVLARRSWNNEVNSLSADQIATYAGCSRSQVFRALKKLERHGAIVRHSSSGRETTYLLVEIKPVNNPHPVSDRGDHRVTKKSPSETGAVSDGDGTSLRQRHPYKEAKLQDCKTVLPPLDQANQNGPFHLRPGRSNS